MSRKSVADGVKEVYTRYAQWKWEQIQKIVSQVCDSSQQLGFSREDLDSTDNSVDMYFLATDFCEQSRNL